MQQDFIGREPDTVDQVNFDNGYTLWNTWLDDRLVSIHSSTKMFTNKREPFVKRVTMSCRGDYMRLFRIGTGGKGVFETARPAAMLYTISKMPPAVQSVTSGHLFNEFLKGDDFRDRALNEMWPMIPQDMYADQSKMHPAFRKRNIRDFLLRFVGYSSYHLELALEPFIKDNSSAMRFLQSMPMPQTPYDFRDMIDVVQEIARPGKNWWPVRIVNLPKIDFDHAVRLAKTPFPTTYEDLHKIQVKSVADLSTMQALWVRTGGLTKSAANSLATMAAANSSVNMSNAVITYSSNYQRQVNFNLTPYLSNI